MADIAFRPGVVVRKAAAKKAAIKRKHRGDHEGAIKVIGQTAAVAGISGALLLALKAMVLIAPSVLPHGNGLDSLGRPVPNVGADNATTPVSIGKALDAAPNAAAASSPAGLTTHPAGGLQNTGGQVTTSGGGNPGSGNAGGTTPGGGTSGGSTTSPAAPGPVGSLVNSVAGTASNLPVVGPTLGGVVSTVTNAATPVTNAVDGVTAPVTKVLAPVLAPVTGITNSLPVVGQLTSGLSSGSAGSGATSGLLGTTAGLPLVGGLLG